MSLESASRPVRRVRSSSQPVFVEMAKVERTETRWLWPGKIPLGKLTLLAGDPELGKSFLTVDMAARITRGLPWPDGTESISGSVIFMNAEDELEDTVCPRLEKAGADLEKCSALAAARSEEDGLVHPLSLGHDLAVLREALQAKPDCRLVVIDPISAYLGPIDGNSNTEVRGLLFPLAQLAAEHQVAVVAVTHLNKSGMGQAIYRAIGSLAFVAAARSAWVVVRDPHDANRQLFLNAKSNLASKFPGLAYRFKAESKLAIATIDWETNPIEQSVDEVLRMAKGFNTAAQEYRDGEHYASTWLRERLSNGPLTRDDVFARWARPFGMSDPQVYRAAQRLGVAKVKTGLSNTWMWALPEHTDALMAQVGAEKERQQEERGKERSQI
jgi:putative DNA primase/helicase